MNRKNFIATLGAGGLLSTMLDSPAQSVSPAAGSAAPHPVKLDTLLNLDDVEAAAKSVMPPAVFDFVYGAAADEITTRWNREKYREIRLLERILQDLSGLDPSTTLFGQKMPTPIILAPTASQRLSHPEGELATTRGANLTGTTMCLSAGSNTAIEDVIAVATGPVWFQLYVMKDRGRTKALVERVQAAGVKALCVTVDSPLDGARNRQFRNPAPLPPGGYPHYVGVTEPGSIQTLDVVRPANLLWKDIEWLRSFTKVKMLLKGVMNPIDADIGIKAGADGIIVSNHGGRCLDTQPATIEALPRVVRTVDGRVPVIVDGGIRRGTDIVKALALGASAIQIGRPYVAGLAVGGAEGVAHVIKILRQELLMAMSLLGCPTISSIDRSRLWE